MLGGKTFSKRMMHEKICLVKLVTQYCRLGINVDRGSGEETYELFEYSKYVCKFYLNT